MSFSLVSEFVEFIPPRLQKNSLGWHIEYYVHNPVTDKMERKRFRLNQLARRCQSQKQFKDEANKILAEVTRRLALGQPARTSEKKCGNGNDLKSVCEVFIKEKERELRPASIRTYKGILKLLFDWLGNDVVICEDLTHEVAVDFMAYCFNERGVGTRTYNGYIKQLRSIFAWVKERCGLSENPFVAISFKKEGDKERIVIKAEDRLRIREWCLKQAPEFLIVLELIYFSGLRPSEISRLQVRHLRLIDHCIELPGKVTKCHIGRFSALSTDMCIRLAELVNGNHSSDYIFGEGYKPAKRPISVHQYQKKWARLRKALDLPAEYQLYSLRDSGITDKLRSGMNVETVMKTAGHTSLETTTKYLDKIDRGFINESASSSPSF